MHHFYLLYLYFIHKCTYTGKKGKEKKAIYDMAQERGEKNKIINYRRDWAL